MKATFCKRELEFSFPAGTSRGVLTKKTSWYIKIWLEHAPEIYGLGECSPIFGLSPENEIEYETKIIDSCANIRQFESLLKTDLLAYPSIYFGIETALMDLFKGGKRILFHTPFTNGETGIKINGLVWMNSIDEMYREAIEKINSGFTCLKFKIGTHHFQDELNLLKEIRKNYPELIIRTDANGAYDFTTAVTVLNELKQLNIHSIEQPLKKGDDRYAELCANNIIPIALDEELIGIHDFLIKEKLIQQIKPQFLILKPSLHGGLMGTRQWISLAERNHCGWWITSALESNVGLNAISQFTAQTGNNGFHGLGTGKIYTNNVQSPLQVVGEELRFTENKWEEIF